MSKKKSHPELLITQNRRSSFKYQLTDRFEAGIALMGSEVKSLRSKKANLNEAYVSTKNGEAELIGAYIAPYDPASYFGHSPTRTRKLLLHKREIIKLEQACAKKGIALIPTKLYFNKEGRAKIEIALGKGKKMHDKREDLRKHEATRDIERALKKKR